MFYGNSQNQRAKQENVTKSHHIMELKNKYIKLQTGISDKSEARPLTCSMHKKYYFLPSPHHLSLFIPLGIERETSSVTKTKCLGQIKLKNIWKPHWAILRRYPPSLLVPGPGSPQQLFTVRQNRWDWVNHRTSHHINWDSNNSSWFQWISFGDVVSNREITWPE